MTALAKVAGLVAEVCLYGTQQAGAGWIAALPDGRMMGDGEPKPGRSMTEAVWLAADELRAAGVARGTIRIFMAGGDLCADVEISKHIPSFGDLRWQRAPVYAIGVEELMRHAEVQP